MNKIVGLHVHKLFAGYVPFFPEHDIHRPGWVLYNYCKCSTNSDLNFGDFPHSKKPVKQYDYFTISPPDSKRADKRWDINSRKLFRPFQQIHQIRFLTYRKINCVNSLLTLREVTVAEWLWSTARHTVVFKHHILTNLSQLPEASIVFS